MAAWKRKGGLAQYYDKIVNGMTSRGYERAFAEAIFEQIKGFSEYGFLSDPERINVAMSRAKDRLVIVSSSAMWRSRTATPMHRVLDEVDRLAEQRLAQFVPSKELKRSLSHA